jgi:hypothetical protein
MFLPFAVGCLRTVYIPCQESLVIHRNVHRIFTIAGLLTFLVVIGALVAVYWVRHESIKDQIAREVDARIEAERRTRVRACEDANKRDAQVLEVILPLVNSPRAQDALKMASDRGTV